MDKHRLILDTDIGIDDAMALLCLHGSGAVRFEAITTVWGNAPLGQVTRNALAVCERFAIDAPIYAGADAPLGPTLLSNPPVAVHGHNGLGGVELPAPRRQPEALAAADAIAELARTHPGALSMLALGPLSNVALALERCPELPGLLREVVVMGGVFGIGGQRGNVSPVAEANMAADPLAADRVLGSGLPLRLVSLDVTHQTLLDAPLLERIVRAGGEAGAFIRDTAQTYLDFYSPITGQRACPLHDASAAICLLEPALFHYERAAIRVASDGIALGQTIPGDPQADYMSAAWRGRPRCSYTTGVDTGAVRATLLDCLRCEYQLSKNSADLQPTDE